MDGRDWDAVVHTSGYVPAVVGDAARAVSGRAGAYVFFSTVSVYPDWPQQGVSEDSPVYDCTPDVGGSAEDEANWSAAQYGAYKAGCERAATDAFDGRALVLRPGVILGPHEDVGRLTWWLNRIAAGGCVLAPGDPGREIQPIDIRDLVAFTLDRLDDATEGTFNVAAPIGHATFAAMLGECVAVTGSDADLTWVDDKFLLDQGVRQWTETPLWRTHPGTWQVATDRAHASGLRCRPTADTVRDIWAWLSAGQGPTAYGRQTHHGLAPDRKRQLLDFWEEPSHQA